MSTRAITAVLAVVLIFGAFGVGVLATTPHSPSSLAATPTAAHTVVLEPAKLAAQAAILYDLQSGQVLYQKEAYDPLPLASVAKLMTAEVVLSRKSPDTPVEITAADIKPEGDSKLRVGQTLLLRDLISLALVASSNDAIEAAAHTLGSNYLMVMNETAQTLGLTKTRFYNATGLDIDIQTAGAYGSAYDVTRLAALLYLDHPDFFELTTRSDIGINLDGGEIVLPATAVQLHSLPGFVAAKTGYTDLAGGNLVAVFDLEPGHTVVAAILHSTREGRFTDMKTLIESARIQL